jgi:pilus assembly protein Flp/PilA
MVAFVAAFLGLLFPREREGQGLIEYGLIIVLIAIAIITLIGLMGGQVANVYSRITASIAG